ncbi:OLC1v1010235C1 [Oldenlandia corymbosa var. corymbosa]|uniref:OLC1v1010235C1 n=1 Tax=Oldenlandia corymbosa var. corymbosa TaxID=529605 RepID=A0AAV1DT86_OLDCO|nr:OLC1v1010235C1 [Oldenlandia corymbosa var. corymbosa]
MGKNHHHFLCSLFLCLFFPCFNVQAQNSDYRVPDQYFINCGSAGSTTVNGRNFVGDVNPNSFTLSAPQSAVATNPSTNSSATLYGTARIFKQTSWYDLDIVNNGTYLVRFHFSPFISQDGVDLSTARFNVSASNFYLLSEFHVQNSTNNNASSNSPLIKDFFMNLNAGKFQIKFIPSGSSSLAFVNAIEAFLAPDGFISNSTPPVVVMGSSNSVYDGLISNALQVIHRINVGGSLVTPGVDTLGRTWVPDDDYMFFQNATVKTPFRNAPPQYGPGSATRFDAPDPVYNSAKVLNVNSSVLQNINATWSFAVNRNSRFLVRAHFCDILGGVSSDILKFNLFIQNFLQMVDAHYQNRDLAVPFYFDFAVDSGSSGLMNVSMGARQDSDTKTAFLNGLEIMELISSSGSISVLNSKSSKTNLGVIVGSVVGGVVLIIVSAVCLWFYLIRKKAKPVDTVDEWELPDMNRGTSYSRSTDRNTSGSPLPDLNLGLKIALGEVLFATKNFDEALVIGEGGFGKVYRGILRDGTKVAVKRSEPGRTQGFSEFQTEIMVLSKIRHRHLVSLIGYCDDRSEMVLVYEFMEKGTLKDHLYSSKGDPEKPTSEPKQALDNTLPKEQINLAEWGMSHIMKGELEKIIEPSLKGKISPDSLRRFGQIVQKCLQERGTDRPNMVDVLWELEYALQLQQTALPWQPNESSDSEVSYNLPMPLLGRFPSFSAAISEYEMEDSDVLRNRSSNHTDASAVFSQIIMQEPR